MEKTVEFILYRFPFISRRLDVHMLEIINGAAVAFVLKVLQGGLVFCFNLFLARILGVEGAGLYFLCLTVTTIATVFGRMGLDNALLRFTSENAATADWAAVKGVYQRGIKLALISSFISAVVMFAAAPFLAGTVFRKPDVTGPLKFMALAVVPLSLLILHAQMLQGLKRIRDSLLVNGVGVPALSLMGICFFGKILGVKGVVFSYVVSAVLVALFGIWLWRSAVPQLGNIKEKLAGHELLKSCKTFLWIDVLYMITNWTSILALGVWCTKKDIGLFGIASLAATLTSVILTSVNAIAAPKYATLYVNKQMGALDSTARNSTRLMTLLAGPVLALFLFFPEAVMRMFGAGFVGGGSLLSIMAIGQFVNVATGSVGYLLIMSGNELLMRKNLAFIAVLNIILNVTLVPFAGAMGAAIANAVSLSAMNLIGAYLVWTRMKIWTLPIFGR